MNHKNSHWQITQTVGKDDINECALGDSMLNHCRIGRISRAECLIKLFPPPPFDHGLESVRTTKICPYLPVLYFPVDGWSPTHGEATASKVIALSKTYFKFNHIRQLKVVIQWLEPLLCIQEILGLNFDYSERLLVVFFRSSSKMRQ